MHSVREPMASRPLTFVGGYSQPFLPASELVRMPAELDLFVLLIVAAAAMAKAIGR
jgi:hypothetical protein